MDDPLEASPPASPEPSPHTFRPPSLHPTPLLAATSYTHFSPLPSGLLSHGSETPCALGIDEAGRGPVLGPMVYAAFYLPSADEDALMRAGPHRFDDSKRLTPAVRSALMRTLCDPEASSLHGACGWAVSVLSARDIAAGMLHVGGGGANLNAQAVDATVELIRGVYARGVNVRDIYVDTIGQPAPYQVKLQRIFPTARITVAKKADSLYPCVSAASVCAKVTRDAALEALWHARCPASRPEGGEDEGMGWGSGYPSDARCVTWMRKNMHPVFGWGPECRFSWGTAKDMLGTKGAVKVDWPEEEDEEVSRMTDLFATDGARDADAKERNELTTWFGTPAGLEAF